MSWAHNIHCIVPLKIGNAASNVCMAMKQTVWCQECSIKSKSLSLYYVNCTKEVQWVDRNSKSCIRLTIEHVFPNRYNFLHFFCLFSRGQHHLLPWPPHRDRGGDRGGQELRSQRSAWLRPPERGLHVPGVQPGRVLHSRDHHRHGAVARRGAKLHGR